MNDETTTSETTDRGRNLSRRSVVRTAAHAAWAVPLVQVATAAPALAVSTINDIFLVGTPIVTVNGKDVTVSGIVVRNDGPNPLTGVVRILLTSTKTWDSTASQPANSGWVVSGGGTSVLQFIYAGTVPVNPAGTALTPPNLAALSQGSGPTVTVSVTL